MKLALYGGSFDPPHAGHVAIVQEALKILPLDKLIVVPASRNPFKSSVHAEGSVRYEWLKEIFAPYETVEISDFEITQKRSVYSIETVEHFLGNCDKLYFILGADNLESLPHWHRFEELNAKVTWVVATRDHIDIPDSMIRLNVNAINRSSDFRDHLAPLGLEKSLETKILTYYKEHL